MNTDITNNTPLTIEEIKNLDKEHGTPIWENPETGKKYEIVNKLKDSGETCLELKRKSQYLRSSVHTCPDCGGDVGRNKYVPEGGTGFKGDPGRIWMWCEDCDWRGHTVP